MVILPKSQFAKNINHLGHLMFLLTFGGLTMSPCISPLGSLRLARGANPSSFGVSIDRNKSLINGTPAASGGPKILKKVFFILF